MGRKSTVKNRKQLSKKMISWLEQLLPSIQNESLDSITINDISKKTAISKSTLYEYFESKEEIITKAIEIRLNKVDLSAITIDSNQSILLQYTKLIEGLTSRLNDISFHFIFLVKDQFNEAWQVISLFMDKLIDLLKELYTVGIKQNIFRPVSIDLLLKLDQYFITEWLSSSKQNKTIDQLILDYVDLRLNGIVIK